MHKATSVTLLNSCGGWRCPLPEHLKELLGCDRLAHIIVHARLEAAVSRWQMARPRPVPPTYESSSYLLGRRLQIGGPAPLVQYRCRPLMSESRASPEERIVSANSRCSWPKKRAANGPIGISLALLEGCRHGCNLSVVMVLSHRWYLTIGYRFPTAHASVPSSR